MYVFKYIFFNIKRQKQCSQTQWMDILVSAKLKQKIRQQKTLLSAARKEVISKAGAPLKKGNLATFGGIVSLGS